MKSIVHSALCLSSVIFINTYPLVAYAQQTIAGNCNIQIQGNRSYGNITCIASAGFPAPKPRPSPGSVIFEAQVNNLQRGSKTFSLWLRNHSSDKIIEVSTRSIAISDNLGNSYQLDRWANFGLDLRKKIPPKGAIRIDYVLESPINSNANSVSFILDSLTAKQIGDPLSFNFFSAYWSVRFR